MIYRSIRNQNEWMGEKVKDQIISCMKLLHYEHTDNAFDSDWKSDWIERKLSEGSIMIVIAIDKGDLLTGYVRIETLNEEYTNSIYLVIREFYVPVLFRRQRIGSDLMEQVENLCESIGAISSVLDVRPENEALKFYQAIGYETVSLKMKKKC